MPSRVAILDFGGKYTQLIARRIRELGVYSEILPCTEPVERVLGGGYTGIVFSGGPSSVYEADAPLPDKRLLESGIPRLLGREGLLAGVQPEADGLVTVWMSHGDTVLAPPPGFTSLAATDNCPVAAMADPTRRIFAVQFHPEVAHTPQGKTVLKNFLDAAGATADWSMPSFVDAAVDRIRRQVGKDPVLCALSGGVDSSVVAALIHKAVGDQLTCLFVDNGLLRKGEVDGVVRTFRDAFKMNLIHVDASN